MATLLLLGFIPALQVGCAHGLGVPSRNANQTLIPSPTAQQRTGAQAETGPTPTVDATTGMVITMTWEILLDEEWVDYEVTEALIANAKRFIATSTRLSRGNGMPSHRVTYVDGDGSLAIESNSSDSAVRQFGRRLNAELPTLLDERLNWHHARSTSDKSVVRLLDRKALMLDGDEIELATSTGRARVVEKKNVDYAIPATVVEVQADGWTSGIDYHRTWVDNRHGIKFRVEEVRDDGEIGRIGMMVDYEFDVGLEGVDFSPPLLRKVKANYFESQAFDGQMEDVADTSGVEGLLHPGIDPIYGTLRLHHSAYVTGTQETEPGWFVAQELRDGLGAHVLVLQGDDRRSLSHPMYGYWPPSWNGKSVGQALHGELRLPTDFHFDDGTAARVYECTPQSDLTWEHEGARIDVGLQAMDCDELITWVDGTHNRVVLAVTGYDRPTAIDVAMAFRSAAHGRVP